jgi:hypothetical protein
MRFGLDAILISRCVDVLTQGGGLFKMKQNETFQEDFARHFKSSNFMMRLDVAVQSHHFYFGRFQNCEWIGILARHRTGLHLRNMVGCRSGMTCSHILGSRILWHVVFYTP